MNSSEIRAEARKVLSGKWSTVVLASFVFILINAILSFIFLLCSPTIDIEYIGLYLFIAFLFVFLIQMPISYGFAILFIKLKRNENVSYFEFIPITFKNFLEILKTQFKIFLKLIGPIIAFIVSISILILIIAIANFVIIPLFNAIFIDFGSILLAFAVLGILILNATFFLILLIAIIWPFSEILNYIISPYVLYDNTSLSAKEIVDKSREIMTDNKWKYVKLILSFTGWMILVCFTLGIGLLWLLPYMYASQTIFYEDIINQSKQNNITE